jgi:hypothetical protein
MLSLVGISVILSIEYILPQHALCFRYNPIPGVEKVLFYSSCRHLPMVPSIKRPHVNALLMTTGKFVLQSSPLPSATTVLNNKGNLLDNHQR